MIANPFASELSPGRRHVALRAQAANDNLPLAATAPPRHADGNVSTRWPILRCAARSFGFARHETIPAPGLGLGVDAGPLRGPRP